MRGFDNRHPAVIFVYYLLVIVFSMMSRHPVVTLATAAGALLFYGTMNGLKALLSNLVFFGSILVIAMALNPLVSHNGETILFFMNDNQVTLEAVLFGLFSALTLIGVLIWSQCYSRLLTTDKLLYLFGRFTPKLGLLLSMTFRFVPLFRDQASRISSSQKTMGLYAADNVPDKVRGGVRTFDCLLSWALENSIDTADAMKARGYSLPGRTSFSLFSMRRDDVILLVLMGVLTACILPAFLTGKYAFWFYPTVTEIGRDSVSILSYVPVVVFMLIPGVLELKELLKWNYLKSRI